MRWRLAGLIALAFGSWGTVAAAGQRGDWAGGAFGPGVAGPSRSSKVLADDLVRLRDLGGLTLSPDGRWLAFSVRQGIPERNTYVMRWFIAASDGRTPPVALENDGGQPIPQYAYGLPSAAVLPEAAKWSPDGRWLAFRRFEGDRIELWVVNAASRQAHRVLNGQSQAASFTWSGQTLIARTGLNVARFEAALAQEAAHGWLLDGRIPLNKSKVVPTWPDCSLEPNDACDDRVLSFAVGVDGPSAPRPASAAEAGALARPDPQALRADGAALRLVNADDKAYPGFQPVLRLQADAPGAAACMAAACAGQQIRGFGWARAGASAWLLRAEGETPRVDGAPFDVTTLYEWRMGQAPPRQVLRTANLIEDCHAHARTLYCMRETPTRPRHIVSIDLDSGALRVLADPNPTFAAKAFPRVEKLELADGEGNPGFAYIVYPPTYRPGGRYPLVVTQYMERGFLRGQVGNEYPIYPLAEEGFIVVSLTMPWQWESRQRLSLYEHEAQRAADLHDWRRRFDVVDKLVDALVARGEVDEDRIAITGLSAGAELVHYALQRSTRFAAAIASSGMQDVTFLALIPEGARRDRLMATWGANQVMPPTDPLRQLSWALQPERLTTPLLINVGEYEVMLGFEGIATLKQARRPIEVRVFPDEMHIKYHPRTYAGIYVNNLMWLRFWLKGEEDPDPQFAAQYRRWRAMRAARSDEREVARRR